MANDLTGQTMALSAIFQYATLVEKLAKHGQSDSHLLEVAVNSLYCQNPASTEVVYGELKNLIPGLTTLLDTLRRKHTANNDVIRYVMGILHLEKRLAKNPKMLDVIAARLEKSQQQAEHFSLTHDNVIAGLADIYSDTISTFSFRIQVMGEYQYLQQARIANQIRVLLFAGIRSAVLWRQLGGSRLKVIFQRNRLAKITEQLLREARQVL